MGTDTRYLIVGGGLAAARAVEGIREVDETGPVVVLTAEAHLPYERPPLSKGVLLESDGPEVAIPHDLAWYDEHNVEVRTSSPVVGIDLDARTVRLESNHEIGWDRLLLATGSSVRTLQVPGAELPGVHYLRTMDDSLGLLERIKEGGDLVVIGAGWIGLEVTAAARGHGCRVTLIDPQATPLLAVMGEQVGGWFAELHRAHGVDLRLGTGVARIEGETAATGVVTDSGETIPARTVVVGVGIRPNTALAEAAGAQVDNGVVTDESLRTTLPEVWAAGDVANWKSTLFGTHLRVEHWANANDGGYAAGRSMAGAEVTYDPVP
ncbi:MAG: NAD(P)/FAD-dependent oxidoreductase, partial [Propionicimonas sp.]|nr:NAD(P)/FAD-dependent oxidoreductase [Propionicimonas sp.]